MLIPMRRLMVRLTRWTINLTIRVINVPPLVAITIFGLIQDIIETSLEHRTMHFASRVKKVSSNGGRVFQETETMFELVQDIIGTNLLTKFHHDQTMNVASRVLTMFYKIYIMKIPHPMAVMFFSANRYHFRTRPRYHWTNLLTNIKKEKCPAPGGHVFQATVTIFEITILLTKVHEDRKIHDLFSVKNANVDTARRTTHDARETKGVQKTSHCAQVS
ncbi:hypothetical protein DPMN_055207 [Dreissena polymorpha]|uniref:Uncharacterized protein n=1 Tax=Dreissena polymorpha TaxID=45954 RepID=A0A9D4CPJ3_DREPO|nr:hypothetical protein DPMN_055207 [Dreissena polymorpha]